jgi:hypothetical protein
MMMWNALPRVSVIVCSTWSVLLRIIEPIFADPDEVRDKGAEVIQARHGDLFLSAHRLQAGADGAFAGEVRTVPSALKYVTQLGTAPTL